MYQLLCRGEFPQSKESSKQWKSRVVQRQVPAIQKVQKTVEVPQVQHIDRIMNLPVVKRHQEPTIQTEQKTAEVPDAQNLDQVI